MYSETVQALADQATAKLKHQRVSLLSHLVRSMLAGMYVGASIVLILTIGATFSKQWPGAVRFIMGVSFGGALTLVIFAGSELFTGSNLILTLGVLTGKSRPSELAANWIWTWIGNLLGSVLVAFLVVQSGLLDADPVKSFVLNVVTTKMHIAPVALIIRGILANWLVCLAVWMAARTKSDTAKIILIFWCMFTFITSGYEHSVANMTGLMLGVLLPHGSDISLAGYAYNLGLSTLGNIIGGAVFVGAMYWIGSPAAPAAPLLESAAAEQLVPALQTALAQGVR